MTPTRIKQLRDHASIETSECLDEIENYIKVVEAIKRLRERAEEECTWYNFIPCEYAEDIDAALRLVDEDPLETIEQRFKGQKKFFGTDPGLAESMEWMFSEIRRYRKLFQEMRNDFRR